MSKLRIMTFNVENMLVRFDFNKNDEGLVSLLDVDSEIDRANLIRSYWNVVNDENRVFTSLTIKEGAADVVCLQEVENLTALKSFHDRYIKRISGMNYRYKYLIEGNDPRGIDVAVMSKVEVESVVSHQDYTDKIPPDGRPERIFRRDCLEVHVKKGAKSLPIFICHFKSMSGGRKKTRPVRVAEATAVRKIIEGLFSDPAKKDWLVVGDLNDYTEKDGVPDDGHGLGPLLEDGFSVNLVGRIADQKDRWTHFYAEEREYTQLDYILASPALAEKNRTAVPRIIRNGQPFRAERYTGARWPRTGYDRPKASDHCPVVVDLEF